ncbi:zinc finger CCCH domain-containing protein 56 [Scenedesmus sp. PABB004]|nr:zinc finger CCCH domain-containing protein 56 [Scenedesmus sp. PABB004]
MMRRAAGRRGLGAAGSARAGRQGWPGPAGAAPRRRLAQASAAAAPQDAAAAPAFMPAELAEIEEPAALAMAARMRRAPLPIPCLPIPPLETAFVGPSRAQRDALAASAPGRPPVVLLHGFDSSCLEFRRLYPLLEPAVETYAVDLVGWGFTDHAPFAAAPELVISPQAKREHLHAFWRAHVGRPMALVGCSLGGAIALDFALTYPEAVAKLVLIDAQGFIDGIGPMASLPRPLAAAGVWVLRTEQLRMAANKMAYHDPCLATPDAMRVGRLHTHAPGWTDANVAFMRSGGYALSARIPEVTQPALVLWGRQDAILEPRYAAQFEAALPDARLQWVEDCGHCAHLEQPTTTAAAILALLRRPASHGNTGSGSTSGRGGRSPQARRGQLSHRRILLSFTPFMPTRRGLGLQPVFMALMDPGAPRAPGFEALHALGGRPGGGGPTPTIRQRTAEEMMLGFKVHRCTKRSSHDWQVCFYYHPNEKARRRSLLDVEYTAVLCPSMLHSGTCEQGEACRMAHNVFEFYLSPQVHGTARAAARRRREPPRSSAGAAAGRRRPVPAAAPRPGQKFRTKMCSDGDACKRAVCFFAHSLEELRTPAANMQSLANAIAAGQGGARQAGGALRAAVLSADAGSGGSPPHLAGGFPGGGPAGLAMLNVTAPGGGQQGLAPLGSSRSSASTSGSLPVCSIDMVPSLCTLDGLGGDAASASPPPPAGAQYWRSGCASAPPSGGGRQPYVLGPDGGVVPGQHLMPQAGVAQLQAHQQAPLHQQVQVQLMPGAGQQMWALEQVQQMRQQQQMVQQQMMQMQQQQQQQMVQQQMQQHMLLMQPQQFGAPQLTSAGFVAQEPSGLQLSYGGGAPAPGVVLACSSPLPLSGQLGVAPQGWAPAGQAQAPTLAQHGGLMYATSMSAQPGAEGAQQLRMLPNGVLVLSSPAEQQQ